MLQVKIQTGTGSRLTQRFKIKKTWAKRLGLPAIPQPEKLPDDYEGAPGGEPDDPQEQAS